VQYPNLVPCVVASPNVIPSLVVSNLILQKVPPPIQDGSGNVN
jgi:hypothetical protein